MDPGPWVLCDCPCHPGQVVSSILRNLSWRADINSKKVLREVGSMTALMECVLRASKVSIGWQGIGEVRGSHHSHCQETQAQNRETLGKIR